MTAETDEEYIRRAANEHPASVEFNNATVLALLDRAQAAEKALEKMRSTWQVGAEASLAAQVKLLAEYEALRAAVTERLNFGHNDTCGAVLSWNLYPCSCGHDRLRRALG